ASILKGGRMQATEFQSVRNALSGLRLGAPQAHRNLALFPLIAEAPVAGADRADYLLLDEALSRKLARVSEVSAAGSVPELAFENGSDGRKLTLYREEP